MNKTHQGFTLIELMIVVAIIAILAAIAIPAYQDYVIRSQVSEGASLADGSKTAVAEFYSNKGYFPSSNVSAGVATSTSIKGNYVSSVVITGGTAGAKISVSYAGPQANTAIASNVLVFSGTPNTGSTSWSCTTAAGSNVSVKYRPTICRP
jgi:type IV pilus assembly protein PilA